MRIGDALWMKKLVSGAETLGVPLSGEKCGALTLHAEMLAQWNKKVNLTAITRPEEVLEKHFLDSLAVIPFLPETGSVLDMGTGGGFPGLVIAVMRPDLDVFMADSASKKIAFVRNVIREIGLERAKAESLRVEDLPFLAGRKSSFDCIVSRAFSSLDRFLEWSLPLLAPWGKILAMKGPEGLQESETLSLDGLSLFSHSYSLPFDGGNRILLELLDMGRHSE